MSSQRMASQSYAENFVAAPEIVDQAAQDGHRLGAEPVSAATGASLRFVAAAIRAAHVVEVGTGAAASGLWLIDGMAPDGVLTSIDVEPENHRAARARFSQAGIAPQRTRLIAGQAEEVLPRLTDGAYDLVFIDANPEAYPDYVEQAHRLLHRDGVLAIANILWQDKVADPTARDETTTLLRDLGKSLRQDERWIPALLPVGDGLFLAVKR